MFPYVITLLCSVLCLYLAEILHTKGRDGGACSLLFIVIALVLPCVLAGGRDVGVGSDTTGYGAPIFQIAACTGDFSKYLSLVNATKFDVNLGYATLTFLVARLTHSLFVYFFIVQALMLIPFYFGLRRLSGNRYLWLGFSIYYLLFYLQGLSNLRQFLAVSFVVLAFAEFVNNKKIASLILYVVAIGFHSSAAIWIALPILWSAIFNKDYYSWRSRHMSKGVVIVLIIIGLLVYFNIRQVFALLTSLPLFSRYASYLTTDSPASFMSFYPAFGLMLVGVLLDFKRIEDSKTKHIALFYIAIAFLSFPLWALQSFNRQFGRMSIYAWAFFPIALVFILNANKQHSVKTDLTYGPICSLLGSFAYCTWVYVINNGFQTFPYMSELFGIG